MMQRLINDRLNKYYQLTGLEDENPSTVEEEENAKAKLYRVSKCFNVVNVVIEPFPEGLAASVEKKQRISS